nr:tyrosine-protein phosphatase non-receptor type 4 [Leptinotarsa decemlineata]
MIESVSKRAFSGSSGTYNVHALELAAARERKLKGLSVTVRFLDDTEHVFHIEKRVKGAVLLEQVYQHLELVEKDYFGLQYSENGCLPGSGGSVWMRWLDPSKSIKKQLGNCQYPLHFRVKFYVSDPSKLQEEYTRYQFYLQLRRDILEGKLQLASSTAILLASYTVQSELGDYQPEEHGPNYLSHLQLVPNQTEEIENKISELHKLHKGQLPADAEFNFLDYAKRIEMYGVELHKAKDNANKDIQLGVTHIGLVVFQNNVRVNSFSWSKIMKISFKRKQFFIQLRREITESYDTLLGFNMETYRSSKTLWKSCVEHHTFFRLHSPRIRRKFPLSLGSKFTYSGIRVVLVYCPEVKPTVPPLPLEDKGKIMSAPARPPGPYAHKVTSLDTKEPKKAWTEDSRASDDDGGFLERTLEGPFSPGIAGRVMSYADEEQPSPTSNGLYDTPPYSVSHSPTSQIIDDGLVTITLYPDEDEKYGFNVKGGTEIDVPILVSRVAPNTSADKCTPRLSEGDQVVQINGHDVSHALHQDVVRLIQEARSTNGGKLILVVRPNVLYQQHEDFEEPAFQYVPVETSEPLSPGNALKQSMLLLADGLASGALIAHYEMLYRKHPDLTCDESCKPHNINKNRYRDILPSFQNDRSREIKHMQYVAWPDHGVPDSPQQFLNFTERVRAARRNDAPVVVHCSAGIGRTGVLVLMETALCLMEAGEPIYPLEIVKTMREQRAMMIQNASQYRFVCESVHAAYSEKIELGKQE